VRLRSVPFASFLIVFCSFGGQFTVAYLAIEEEMKTKRRIKTAQERATDLLVVYSPLRTRRTGGMYGLIGIVGETPNKTRIEQTTDAYRETWRNLCFLAGMLALIPYLNSNRRAILEHEGQKILAEADEFMKDCKWSASTKRKLTVFTERIVTLKEKIEKDMKAK
jgi:hypothetical protein